MKRVDLNCDMGESFGAWKMGADETVMPHITSANIATGFHAGDPLTMFSTVRLAAKHKVAVGAHPSLPDLVGFGRRQMAVSPDEVHALVVYQVGALLGVARSCGVRVTHIKPHGALYNMAARDEQLAAAIAFAVKEVDRSLVLFGLSGSALIQEAEKVGLVTANEVFADRSYEPDGSLTPRTRQGAVIHDAEEVARRAVEMVVNGQVTARDGTKLAMRADTICVHCDTPNAGASVELLRQRLEAAGVKVLAAGADVDAA